MEFSGSWKLNPIRIPWKCHKGLEGCSSDEFAADVCGVRMIPFLPQCLIWKIHVEQGDLLRRKRDQGEQRRKKELANCKNNIPSSQ